MSDTHASRIVIIGGGLAGILAAIKIIEATDGPLSLSVVEDREQLGRGIAYSTPDLDHIVNGPARIFSLHLDRPDHFTDWLKTNHGRRGWAPPEGTSAADSFPPRLLYGDYVEDTLSHVLGAAAGRVFFRHVRDRARDVEPSSGGPLIHLASGRVLAADFVVLATGLHAADRAIDVDPVLRRDRRYVSDVWADRALNGAETTQNILLLGSSLTSLDALITLEKRGFRGIYTAVSRRGLLVNKRNEVAPWPAFLDGAALPRRISDLLRQVQRERRAIAAAGEDWQRLPPSLKTFLPDLWLGADDGERRRFARHARVFWDVSLHRAAPPAYAFLERVQAEGRFRLLKGRVVALKAEGKGVAATFLPRGGGGAEEVLSADRVINGLGHEFDWRRIADPLARNLQARELVRAHPTGYGIAADPLTGAVLERSGRPSQSLFAIGHPLRGAAWESSSIPEQVAGATALGAAFGRFLPARRDVA
ncbi:FAD/NAD(P)-binding protein [Xanthobacter sp. VNH20]|uniref:FAD/NAD(P)-binding protein n=1 Tax=Xanthobacter sp. VNH20 TaxID=3156616 RepID=UPI0032B504D6